MSFLIFFSFLHGYHSLSCLKDLMDIFQYLMKPIMLIAEPRDPGLLAAFETIDFNYFIQGVQSCFLLDHFLGGIHR